MQVREGARNLDQDLRYAVRQILRNRAFAAAAILSMALGIGATTAVYSVLYGVLVDPYPYRDANRIAFITIHDKHGRSGDLPFLFSEVDKLREAKSIEDAIAQQSVNMTMSGGDIPETVNVTQFTGNGFEFLGVPPLLGRTFTRIEAPEGSSPPPVAVISYSFWKSHYAGDSKVIGKLLELNHQKLTIIGVTGPRFTWRDADVYLPLTAGVDPLMRFQTLIRLKPGVDLTSASKEVDSYVRQFFRARPKLSPSEAFDIRIESLNDLLLGQFKGALFLLFIAVALLLVIGCGNVSILMLSRGTSRQQELAMRAAVGASRSRIARQLLTEAAVLSMTGGVLGIGLAYLEIRLILGLLPAYLIPHEVLISLNIPVLLFSTAISVASGMIAGLYPALQFSRPQLSEILQSGENRSMTSQGSRARAILMTGQVALTVLLLAGAGAAMRNFLDAYTAKLGFDPHNTLMIAVTLPERAYSKWEERSQYFDALTEKLKAAPGVSDATISLGGMPPTFNWLQAVDIVGAPNDDRRRTSVELVSSDFFSALRIPLLQGRTLTRSEVLRGAHVAVVSKAFEQRYFPSTNPIGHLILPKELSQAYPGSVLAPNPSQPYEIVGVVDDIRNDGLHRPILPQVYVPSSILSFAQISLLIRTNGPPQSSIHAIDNSIRSLNQNIAVSQSYVLDDYLSTFVWSYDRFISILFSLFSAFALGLAAIGLFSVVAYAVEQRTREIGIRVALGAQRWDILALTLTSTVWTTVVGLLLGIAMSIGLSESVYHWTQSSMRNATLLAIISSIFLLASVIACILPARRAMRIDPMAVLRRT
jgi:predicted permease